VDAKEHTGWQKRLRRSTWLSGLQRHVPTGAEIVLEAYYGAPTALCRRC
jgi:hypothetical protein